MTRKTKASKKKTATSPDKKLISQCVVFAQSWAAAEAAFRADPGGNGEYAEPAGDPYFDNARNVLGEIGCLPAKTLHGLAAKGRLLAVLADADDGNFADQQPPFLAGLAADLGKLLKHVPDAPIETLTGRKAA